MAQEKYEVKMKLINNSWCLTVNGELVFSGKFETVKRIYNDKKQHRNLINSYIENYKTEK